ncbi:GTPase-activating protein skywalker-like isoform X2 [Mytilus californianus]|uniref:GTPase-activating protein skywalker-like isoform X2 n=1 Tax=Mytilus californianus TaxID=6549 RepID=UPI002246E6C8|nr:GTPase-activating protein skywalker-like isoform X2 [Mytilus californianus]
MHAVIERDKSISENSQKEEVDKNEKEEKKEVVNSQEEVVNKLEELDDNQYEIVAAEAEGSGFSELVDKSAREITFSEEYYTSNANDYDSYGAVMTGLKNNDLAVVKHVLRTNSWLPNHLCRETLWMQICKYLHKAKGDVYTELEGDLLGDRKIKDIQLPSFVDFDNLVSYHLSEDGVQQLHKILAILHHTNPDITYSPLLYPLLGLFLHYMTPSDAYNCIYGLLTSKETFIIQTKVAYEASKRVMRDLTKKFAKSAYVHLVRNCNTKDIDTVFDSWLWWLFSGLPFHYLIRVVDCFLLEGVKVFYRTALSILILFTKYSGKRTSVAPRECNALSSVPQNLLQFCQEMPFKVEKLLKVGFGIRGLTRKEIKKLQLKHEMYLNSRNFLNHEMHRVASHHSITRSTSGPLALHNITTNNSSVITSDMLYTIWTWLPPRFAVCQPELLYTSEEHGTSLMTLYSRVESYQPTLIFIKTTTDEVFGAFCSNYWRDRRQSSRRLCYFGTGETFIFTLSPKKRKYEWVGLREEEIPNTAHMFLAGDNSVLTIGGGHGEAIQLDANLEHCRSQHCDTFDNEPLCSNQDFTCKVVEVYGFH